MTGSVATAFDKPETANFYRDAAQITGALKPTDPLYLFCPDALQTRAKRFLTHFPGTVSYAVKANPGGQGVRNAGRHRPPKLRRSVAR
jgi:ornithine decarboxylase